MTLRADAFPGVVRATIFLTRLSSNAHRINAFINSVAYPFPRCNGMIEKPISAFPSSSGGPKNPPAPMSEAGNSFVFLRMAYQTSQPTALSPFSRVLSRKNSCAGRSYSPGGQPSSIVVFNRNPNFSGDSNSAERCSNVAATNSRRGVWIFIYVLYALSENPRRRVDWLPAAARTPDQVGMSRSKSSVLTFGAVV